MTYITNSLAAAGYYSTPFDYAMKRRIGYSSYIFKYILLLLKCFFQYGTLYSDSSYSIPGRHIVDVEYKYTITPDSLRRGFFFFFPP